VLLIACDFGRLSAEFRYRIDDGDWQVSNRDRPYWCGNDGWYRTTLLADDLADGPHTAEIEVIHGDRDGCTGTTFRIGLIGMVK